MKIGLRTALETEVYLDGKILLSVMENMVNLRKFIGHKKMANDMQFVF